MSAGDVLVVGGYGEVGRIVVDELVPRVPGLVVVGGRDLSRALASVASIDDGSAVARRVDLSDPATFPWALEGVGSVVVCAEQTSTDFVEACLRRGIDYVDVTASHPFLQRVEALDGLAQANGATCVLSVGLAPGLTNLLARCAVDALDGPESVDISLLLGLADVHGPDAIEWTLARAPVPYVLGKGAAAQVVRPFTGPRPAELPPPYGRRAAYHFDFADQHVLPRTLGVAEATTRLCFDSVLVTRILAALASLRVLGLLRSRWLRRLVVRLLRSIRLGSSAFVAQVDLTGTRDGRRALASAFVRGTRQSYATGVVAAHVVEHLLETSSPGVWHIEQLIEPRAALHRLAEHGFDVSLPDSPSGGPEGRGPEDGR